MLGNLMWAVTFASIVGTIANIYGKRWGFGVWLATNLSWAAYDIWIAAWAQAALFVVYSGTAVWGLIKWKEGRPRK
jgi:hypothetical protein